MGTELLHTTSPCSLLAQSETDLYWGCNAQGVGENRYGTLLEEMRASEVEEEAPTSPERLPSRGRGKNKRGKRLLYRHHDGTATFDMVSSDQVRVSVAHDELVIPMHAIPSRAKRAAHEFQYYKKKHPEALDDVEEDEDDTIDPELAKQFVFERFPQACNSTPPRSLEERFSDEIIQLLELGYLDVDANFAALVSTDGDLSSAVEMLVTGQ